MLKKTLFLSITGAFFIVAYSSESQFESKLRSIIETYEKSKDMKSETSQQLIRKLEDLIDLSSLNKQHIQPQDRMLIDLIQECLNVSAPFRMQEIHYTVSSLSRCFNADVAIQKPVFEKKPFMFFTPKKWNPWHEMAAQSTSRPSITVSSDSILSKSVPLDKSND